MSTSAKDLRETLTAHCKHERHRTYAETLYWLSQYKDLARRAVQHSETVAAKLQEQTERAESAETELRKLRPDGGTLTRKATAIRATCG